MNATELIKLRKQAEKAVADMSEGELKVKAFEVILNHLLPGAQFSPPTEADTEERPKKKGKAKTSAPTTLSGRVLVLRDEGFFHGPRAIGEVRDELAAHGWHYPLTTLSGSLQSLVRARDLRRQKTKHGNKTLWKYTNP